MTLIALILTSLMAGKAFAQDTSPPELIFFGGFKANLHQMKSWQEKAQADLTYGDKYHFTAVSFPSRFSLEQPVLHTPKVKNLIRIWVEKIIRNPEKKYILAGHSSGSAISNEIDREVSHYYAVHKQKSNIEHLFVLDGFYPRGIASNYTCVTTEEREGGRRLYSLRANSMLRCPFHHRLVLKPPPCELGPSCHCRNTWCLHFSLVNKSSAELKVNAHNYASLDYASLVPNLNWLGALSPKEHLSTPWAESNRLTQ